jgi:hypothetical protein
MPGNEGGAANPVDVQARYANATKLLAAGQLDEATTEFVWLWENMLGLAPHMVGVRGSFMVMVLQQLVARHPPARACFLAFRDALTAVVEAGAPMLHQFFDWACSARRSVRRTGFSRGSTAMGLAMNRRNWRV